MNFEIVALAEHHIPDLVALQKLCFPDPFPEDQLWSDAHLRTHIERFPEGQFVVISNGKAVASCTNILISEASYAAHANWQATVGGPFLEGHDSQGTTLYGVDISVHPVCRLLGIGRQLYARRFDFVTNARLSRYATACRLPGFRASGLSHPDAYAEAVSIGKISDPTLTPLLKYGLTFIRTIDNYLVDFESGDAAALLTWEPGQ